MARLPGKPVMKTGSKKAKGRRLQDETLASFRELAVKYGLDPMDITPAIMGTSGVDIKFSPAAKKFFDISIECKNHERHARTIPMFVEHYRKYHFTKHRDEPTREWNGDTSLKILVYDKNFLREGPLVILRLEDFMRLLDKASAPLTAQPFLEPKVEKNEEAT